jgi:hypothetical protein
MALQNFEYKLMDVRTICNMEQTKKITLSNKYRIIGGLFLLAFIFYGGGSALVSSGQQTLGLLLMLMNSAVVIGIGVLIRTIIARDALFSANIYLCTRLAEALLLGVGAIVWTLGSETVVNGEELNTTLYRLSMIILGMGSIGFCRWLIATKAINVLLAWLGLIGYPLLALSMIAEFFGGEYWATIFLIPGAMFELIFGLSLLFVGLRSPLQTNQNLL